MENKPYSLLSFNFWKAYWITLRPYLFFVSGIAGFYGITNNPDIPLYKLILGTVAFFFTYGLGQALTDVFQTDTDSISSPYRPLVQGLITKKQVFCVSLAGLFSCVVIFTIFNPWMLLPGILSVLGLITYTFFKRRWWGGPFWNAWIVATLTIMGKMVHTLKFSQIFDPISVRGVAVVFHPLKLPVTNTPSVTISFVMSTLKVTSTGLHPTQLLKQTSSRVSLKSGTS